MVCIKITEHTPQVPWLTLTDTEKTKRSQTVIFWWYQRDHSLILNGPKLPNKKADLRIVCHRWSKSRHHSLCIQNLQSMRSSQHHITSKFLLRRARTFRECILQKIQSIMIMKMSHYAAFVGLQSIFLLRTVPTITTKSSRTEIWMTVSLRSARDAIVDSSVWRE